VLWVWDPGRGSWRPEPASTCPKPSPSPMLLIITSFPPSLENQTSDLVRCHPTPLIIPYPLHPQTHTRHPLGVRATPSPQAPYPSTSSQPRPPWRKTGPWPQTLCQSRPSPQWRSLQVRRAAAPRGALPAPPLQRVHMPPLRDARARPRVAARRRPFTGRCDPADRGRAEGLLAGRRALPEAPVMVSNPGPSVSDCPHVSI
jgi:hypothetical protein